MRLTGDKAEVISAAAHMAATATLRASKKPSARTDEYRAPALDRWNAISGTTIISH